MWCTDWGSSAICFSLLVTPGKSTTAVERRPQNVTARKFFSETSCQLFPHFGPQRNGQNCTFYRPTRAAAGWSTFHCVPYIWLIHSGYFKQMILEGHFWKIENTISAWAAEMRFLKVMTNCTQKKTEQANKQTNKSKTNGIDILDGVFLLLFLWMKQLYHERANVLRKFFFLTSSSQLGHLLDGYN